MNIVGLPPETIFEVYPLLREYFESFAKRSSGEVTAHELALAVAKKEQQCWVVRNDAVRGCALTRVDVGQMKVVEITHCAGAGREEWQAELVKHIEEWAAHIGATRVRTINRPGWTPFLRGIGYRETHRIMEREIG